MKFTELFETYLTNSSVSEHQAKFIWNHAIEEAHKLLQDQASKKKPFTLHVLKQPIDLDSYF
jgi:hypothetical protein